MRVIIVKLKLLLVFILVFCWASLAFSQGTTPNSLKEGKTGLLFEETSYDFGILDSDSVVSHVFKFKNISNDTIKINRVQTH
jgi:hypothetical protein